MSKTFKLAAVAALCACGALSAQAGVTFDANVEADVTHSLKRTNPAVASSTDMGGRVELNANAELLRNGDYFANAKGTLIVPFTGGEAKVDDAWLQFGSSTVDLKLGRFEAADLFPLGLDTIVAPVTDGAATPAAIAGGYRANALRGRMTDGRFHGALGFNAAPGLRLELGVVAEKAGVTTPSGLRPTLVYTAGAVTLRAGVEAVQNNAGGSDYTGAGVSVGYTAGALALNANYARADKLDASSVGINALYNGALGLGWVQDKTGSNKADTVYAAYKMPLLGVKNAFVTPALSYSTGTGVDSGTAFRVRFNYAF